MAKNAHKYGTENQRINRMIAWNSKRLIQKHHEQASVETDEASENRVALLDPIICAYLSPCWCCKYCSYDCKGNVIVNSVVTSNIRGPCG